jgi:hypothetical protein
LSRAVLQLPVRNQQTLPVVPAAPSWRTDIGDPDLVDSAHLTVLDEVRIYRQRMAGIGRTYKRAPRDGLEPELFHHAAYTFLIHVKTTAFQRASEAPISVARKFLVNAFDLLTQVFILVVTTFSVLFVGFVIKRAGG